MIYVITNVLFVFVVSQSYRMIMCFFAYVCANSQQKNKKNKKTKKPKKIKSFLEIRGVKVGSAISNWAEVPMQDRKKILKKLHKNNENPDDTLQTILPPDPITMEQSQQQHAVAMAGLDWIYGISHLYYAKVDKTKKQLCRYNNPKHGLVLKYDLFAECGYLYEPDTAGWYLFTCHQLAAPGGWRSIKRFTNVYFVTR